MSSLLTTLLENKGSKAKHRGKIKKKKYLLKQYETHLKSMPEVKEIDEKFDDELFKKQKHWATWRTVFNKKLLELGVTHDELKAIDTRILKQDAESSELVGSED